MQTLRVNNADNSYLEGIKKDAFSKIIEHNKNAKYKIDFFESEWSLQDKTSLKRIKFNFVDFEKYRYIDHNIILLIKSWFISVIDDYSEKTLEKYFLGLKLFFEIQGELDSLELDSFIELYRSYRDDNRDIGNIRNCLKSFLSFHGDYFSMEILEFIYSLDEFTDDKSTVREIPPTKDILIFNEVTNDYFKKRLSKEQYFRYKPVQLWWELTTIIPTRPIEFLKLKKKDFYYKKGRYYVEIKRVKMTRNYPVIISKVAISKRIYDLFKGYIRKIKQEYDYESEYIFNYQTVSRDWRGGTDFLDNVEIILPTSFNHILDEYYNKIVLEKYKVTKVDMLGENFYEVSKFLRMGDTRHIAFINLKRLGYHKKEIANIGGHVEYNSQNHYFNHVKNLVDLEILNLLYGNGLSKHTSKDIDLKFISKYVVEHPESNLLKLEDGYCKDKLMRCQSEDCWECEYWGITEEELEEKKHILIEKMNNKRNELNGVIDYLGEVYKSFDAKIDSLTSYHSKELTTTSNKIDLLVSQFINLSKLMGEDN